MKLNKFWYAVATLVGSTVGVGIYGIPFVFARASFGMGVMMLVLVAILVLFTNLLYGEIILRTHVRHQFVGYVNTYLGSFSRKLNIFNFWISVYGSLVGTIIISGELLHTIIGSYISTTPFILSTFFIILTAILISSGLRTVSRFDFIMMLVFGAIVWLFTVFGLPHVHLSHIMFGVNSYWLLPLGVLLFATNGIFGVPLMREVLVGSEHKMRKAIITGTLIPVGLYLLFAFIVVGISGEATSSDAFAGLKGLLGSRIITIGALFGFLTSTTIFLNSAVALRESLHEDFKFKSYWSWILVILVPYTLFALGLRNFINTIGIVGGVGIALDMLLLVLMYARARKKGTRMPEYTIHFPKWILYTMIILFAAGACYATFVK